MSELACSYTTFIKHATKVTRSVKTRPVLKGILHQAKDHSLIATDAYRLYKATDVYSGTKDTLIDPVTGEVIAEPYPATDRLIPTNPAIEFKLTHIKTLARLIKPLWELARYSENLDGGTAIKKLVHLIIAGKDNSVWLKTDANNTIPVKLKIAKYTGGADFTIAIRAGYLLEALDLFRDAGIDELTAQCFGDMRPFVLTGGNLLALLMPIRIHVMTDA